MRFEASDRLYLGKHKRKTVFPWGTLFRESEAGKERRKSTDRGDAGELVRNVDFTHVRQVRQGHASRGDMPAAFVGTGLQVKETCANRRRIGSDVIAAKEKQNALCARMQGAKTFSSEGTGGDVFSDS